MKKLTVLFFLFSFAITCFADGIIEPGNIVSIRFLEDTKVPAGQGIISFDVSSDVELTILLKNVINEDRVIKRGRVLSMKIDAIWQDGNSRAIQLKDTSLDSQIEEVAITTEHNGQRLRLHSNFLQLLGTFNRVKVIKITPDLSVPKAI